MLNEADWSRLVLMNQPHSQLRYPQQCYCIDLFYFLKIWIPCIIWLVQALPISSCYTDMVLETCSASFNVLVLKLLKKPLFFILNIFLVKNMVWKEKMKCILKCYSLPSAEKYRLLEFRGGKPPLYKYRYQCTMKGRSIISGFHIIS